MLKNSIQTRAEGISILPEAASPLLYNEGYNSDLRQRCSKLSAFAAVFFLKKDIKTINSIKGSLGRNEVILSLIFQHSLATELLQRDCLSVIKIDIFLSKHKSLQFHIFIITAFKF